MTDEVPVEDLRVGDVIEVPTMHGPWLIRVTAIVPRANGIKYEGRNRDGVLCSSGAPRGQLMRRIGFDAGGDGTEFPDHP